MVMQRNRVLTVEEFKALPPPTPEEIEEQRIHKAAWLAGGRAISQRILERRGGVPISDEDIEWALRHDDDDEDCED
jgi:hypothetical protein